MIVGVAQNATQKVEQYCDNWKSDNTLCYVYTHFNMSFHNLSKYLPILHMKLIL